MRDIVLALIFIALVPIILRYAWVGIPTLYWVSIMTPQLQTWSFMYAFPAAMLFAAVTLVALVFSKDRQPLPVTREMVLLFLLAAYFALTSHFALMRSDAWDFWIHFMKILLVTFITPMLVYGERRIIVVLLVITGSLAFFGFKGGIFAIQTAGAYRVLGPSGSFLGGNTYIGLAMIMILPLILVSARMFHQRWVEFGIPAISRFAIPIGYAGYAVFWLTAIAILATHSRGAFVGLVAVAPLLFLHMKKKILMGLVALVAVGVVGVSAPEVLVERWKTIENYEEDHSAMQRIQTWGVNWNMAMERPLIGMGFRNNWIGYERWLSYAEFDGGWGIPFSPHSIYFGLLGAHGFIGLGVYLMLAGFTWLTLNRIRRTARRRTGQVWLSEYAWALQVGLTGYLVAGIFLDVAYFSLFYYFVALAIIMRRELEGAPQKAPIIRQRPRSAYGPREQVRPASGHLIGAGDRRIPSPLTKSGRNA